MFFFPIACAVYFVVPRKLRVLWLLVCSYAFYMAWNVKYAGLMAVSTLATYVSGLALDNAQNELKRTVPDSSRKAILAACIVFNLAILGVFKYGNMVLSTLHSGRTLDLLLPVGISFYTFQALGYIIDVYRGEIAA
ncbi:MAG: MBOAT family protein, partial [Firmicutes bacterium]|nr:MBOAT family protein [Bacillota bacterium]